MLQNIEQQSDHRYVFRWVDGEQSMVHDLFKSKILGGDRPPFHYYWFKKEEETYHMEIRKLRGTAYTFRAVRK